MDEPRELGRSLTGALPVDATTGGDQADGDPADAVDDIPPAPPPPRAAWLFLAGWVGLVVAANIGTISSPSLQKSHPALLLALSSRNRHLLMAIGNDISPVTYAIVGTLRIALAAFVCYGLGRAFGPRALRWLRLATGTPKASLDKMEQSFELASWFLVPFFVGSNIICLLAGQRPLPVKRFAALLAVGIAGRLALFWVLADSLRGPLDAFVKFTSRFQWPLMAILLVWVVGSTVFRFRRGSD